MSEKIKIERCMLYEAIKKYRFNINICPRCSYCEYIRALTDDEIKTHPHRELFVSIGCICTKLITFFMDMDYLDRFFNSEVSDVDKVINFIIEADASKTKYYDLYEQRLYLKEET